MYRMMTAEMKPTPMPVTRRPMTKRATWFVDTISNTQPTQKTTHPMMMVGRRPMKSATSPATSDPTNVPQDNIDVMSDLVDDGRPNSVGSTSTGRPAS